MIEARGLSKRFGDVVAVDDLSFVVRPGTVTGFPGTNGSGKSTTMRMIMGLDSPASWAGATTTFPGHCGKWAGSSKRRPSIRVALPVLICSP
jgi:ABC-2 type transport system ATP-binding protein